MDFKLSLLEGEVRRDLLVHAPDTALLGDVARTLAAELGAAPSDTDVLVVERTGARLGPSDPLITANLRSGDVVRIERTVLRHGLSRPAATVALQALSGSRAGSSLELSDGSLVVGRSADSDVVLADPSVSRLHARLVVDGSAVQVSDLGSSAGTFVNGQAVTSTVAVGSNDLIEFGEASFRIVRRGGEDAVGPIEHFNRPPRPVDTWAPADLSLPAPPAEAHRSRIPLASALLPLALAPVLYLMTKQTAMLAFLLLSPIIVIASVWEDRHGERRDHLKRLTTWWDAVTATSAALADERRAEAEHRRNRTPSLGDVADVAIDRRPTRWERRSTDADFCVVRLGLADRRSQLDVVIAPGGPAKLREEAARIFNRIAVLPDVPYTVDLCDARVVGFSGDGASVDAVASDLVAHLAVTHSPADVDLAIVVGPERAANWDWAKWLPHVEQGADPPLVAAAPADARRVLDRLAGRLRPDAARSSKVVTVVVFDGTLPVSAETLLAVAAMEEPSVVIVWLGDEPHRLPGACQLTVAVDPTGTVATDLRSGERVEVRVDLHDPSTVLEVARALAGVVDVTATSDQGAMPSRVDLLELVDSAQLDAPSLEARWSRPSTGLVAVIGRSASGPVTLDLGEHGDHVLVGGTTGSGKSELLQSLVCSLALAHPPERVTFLLIDYKGGTAFKQCVGLPHTVGFVTDLDRELTTRALVSLAAEVRHRLEVLDHFGAKDLTALEQLQPLEAPPRLVIIVDEFATLAREIPDFVEGLVDIAARGRALGIRLVLATQRPAGVINDRMRANIGSRIALRLNDAADSRDVIDAPDAATLPEIAGRAILSTAAGDLVTFQSAFVGGARGAREAGVVVRPLGLSMREPRRRGPAADERADVSDLDRIVAATADAVTGAPPPRPPWLAPLPDVVPFEDLPTLTSAGAPDGWLVTGLADLPDQQRQEPFAVPLDEVGHLLVFGTSGAGKTTLARTAVASLARRCGIDEVQVYVLDFASRGLGQLAALPHVGAVVFGDEIERVVRTFAMLRRTVDERKRLFADVGVASLPAYRAATSSSMARIVVILDGYPAFASTFGDVDHGELVHALPRLLGEARQVGVHFLLTADRNASIPGGVSGTVNGVVALRLANDNEYVNVGAPPPPPGTTRPPGRGFSRGAQVQIALVGSDPTGASEAEAVDALAARLVAEGRRRRASPVDVLPEQVDYAAIRTTSKRGAPLGLSFDDLRPVAIDLLDGHFLVSGPPRSGRSTTLSTLVAGLEQLGVEPELLTGRPRGLRSTGRRSVLDPAASAARLEVLAAELEIRRGSGAQASPIVIVIDDADALAEGPATVALEALARDGVDYDVHLVASVETHSALRTYAGWLKELRRVRRGLLIDPDLDLDGDLLGVRLPRRRVDPRPPGRGYLCSRGRTLLVQVATTDGPGADHA